MCYNISLETFVHRNFIPREYNAAYPKPALSEARAFRDFSLMISIIFSNSVTSLNIRSDKLEMLDARVNQRAVRGGHRLETYPHYCRVASKFTVYKEGSESGCGPSRCEGQFEDCNGKSRTKRMARLCASLIFQVSSTISHWREWCQ